MGQKGFWDEQERVSKLNNKKPVLTCPSELIPWDALTHCLTRVTVKSARAMQGRKGIDPLILFKILVL